MIADPAEVLKQVESIQQKIAECPYSATGNSEEQEQRLAFKKEIAKQFDDFAQKCPAIFQKTMNEELDMKQFSFMVNMARQVHGNEMSQHDASVKVGENLVDTYVKPQLKKDKKDKR
jgi:hypothetical protein